MLKLRTLLVLVFTGLALGQVTPNSVTVNATRNASVQPDQVVFGVFVDTPSDAARDDVIAALQGSGITLANFSSVRSFQGVNTDQTVTTLEWSFYLTAALSTMKSTTGLLSAVQKSVAESKPGFKMFFGVEGTQTSPQAAQQAQPCPLSDLVADARAQAQKMASAAGGSVGAILGISSATLNTNAANPLVQVGSYPICSLTVKFALVGGF